MRSEDVVGQTGAVGTCAEAAPSILFVHAATLVGDALLAVFPPTDYRVERATDGNEAWAKLSSDLLRFDLVIADHETSTPSALQLIGRLRDAKYPGRVIVHARTLSAEDAELYRQMGVEAVVANEVDAARLLRVVKAFHRQE